MNMTIINIDASEYLVRKVGKLGVIEFVLDIFHHMECDYYHKVGNRKDFLCPVSQVYPPHPLIPQRKLGVFGFELLGHELLGQELFGSLLGGGVDISNYKIVSAIIHNIPILLKESRPNETPDDNCIIDALGAYYSNRKGNNPYIELYLKAIDSASQNNDEHFKWLFTQVLLHELAHAVLDFYNYEGLRHYKTEKVRYQTEFGRWREESMANAIALKIIKDYGDNAFYKYTKKFMSTQQPAEYALGVLMEKFTEEDFMSVFDGKILGVNSTIQGDWLKYVKGNPNWKGLQKWNELLSSHLVFLVEGEYRTPYATADYIVNKELSDYEKKNGKKMSSSTFCSIFPHIQSAGWMFSYESEDEHKLHPYVYRPILGLKELYLCYCWTSESLHKFLANVNVAMQEFRNHES